VKAGDLIIATVPDKCSRTFTTKASAPNLRPESLWRDDGFNVISNGRAA